MTTLEIKQLIVDRKRECGMGLCGGCEVIARWLFREHNVVASTSSFADVIKESGIK